ncbi:MAG: tetratricopeptide repeat protein [Gammaproteobacteria bacterium]|jgi:TolB-like protein
MSLFAELRRRNVIRVGAAYIVTAWLIVQVVETLFPVYGLSDAAIRLVVNILAIGLIPVLVLSWVFEWTPEGLKREAEVDHGKTVSLDAAKRLDRIILVVLAVALGYFVFDKFVLDPMREEEEAIQQQAQVEQARQEGVSEGLRSRGEASIAVLAFEDMSPGDDQEYISEGIAEDILNLLQRMPELDVRSRTSAFRFKDSDLSVPQIAQDLGVDHVLEGSVRMLGDRIRITAQLIDARNDSHLWSENFDREIEDVFDILDEISLSVAEQIGIELLSELPRAERIDADAYFLFLRGNHLVYYIDHVAAADYFEQALAIEPDYVDALLGVSRAYFEMAKDDPDYWQKSTDAWDRARELDPDHPVILAYDGWQAMQRGEYKNAARLVEKAMSGDSKSFDVVEAAIILAMAIRRSDLDVRLGDGAVRRDPYCAACNYRLALALYRAGRYAEAESALLRSWELAPDIQAGILSMAKILMMQGKYEEALGQFEVWKELGNRDSWWGPLMIRALEGEDVSRQLEELEDSDAPRVSLAEVAAVSGDIETAFRLLGQTGRMDATEVSFGWRYVNSNFFENLHGDPRWAEIEERAGLAAHQLAEINFNPRLLAADTR